MKTISKKLVLGAIAATILFGGAGLLPATQVSAAVPGEPSAVSDTNFTAPLLMEDQFDFKNDDLIKELAKMLGVNERTIIDALKRGKTLKQIAEGRGLKPEDYHRKLMDAIQLNIDEKVKAGTITEDEAKEQKSAMSGFQHDKEPASRG